MKLLDSFDTLLAKRGRRRAKLPTEFELSKMQRAKSAADTLGDAVLVEINPAKARSVSYSA